MGGFGKPCLTDENMSIIELNCLFLFRLMFFCYFPFVLKSDRSALEFILGLHDMWSRVIAKSSGMGPWWIGDQVVTVPERHTIRRRLLEETESIETTKIDVDAIDNENIDDNKKDKSENADETDSVRVVGSVTEKGFSAGDVSSKETESEVDGIGNKNHDDDPQEKGTENEKKGDEEGDEKDEEEDGIEGESTNDVEEDDGDDSDDEEEEESTGDIEPGALVLDAGAQQEVAADEEKRGDSDEDDEDVEQEVESEEGTGRDFSSYDTWMGILSSAQIKYFVRIVPSSEVGVVSIDDE